MFKRLALPEVHEPLTYAVFALNLGVFLFFFIRAIRMKKDNAARMSRLPLDDDQHSDS